MKLHHSYALNVHVHLKMNQKDDMTKKLRGKNYTSMMSPSQNFLLYNETTT